MTTEATMRVRATDPITSHLAAERASRFAGSHAERILAALRQAVDGQGSAEQIAHATGLTVVQAARRLPELQRDGKVRVATKDGRDVLAGAFRVWEVVP